MAKRSGVAVGSFGGFIVQIQLKIVLLTVIMLNGHNTVTSIILPRKTIMLLLLLMMMMLVILISVLILSARIVLHKVQVVINLATKHESISMVIVALDWICQQP